MAAVSNRIFSNMLAQFYGLRECLLACGFYLFFKLFFYLVFHSPQSTFLWPFSGMALGILFYLGTGAIPGLFLGAILANIYFTAYTLPLSISLAAVSVFCASFAHYLLKKYVPSAEAFDRFKTIGFFILIACVFGGVISSTLSNALLFSLGSNANGNFFKSWLAFFVSEVGSTLIVVPWLFSLNQLARYKFNLSKFLEFSFVFFTLWLTSGISFGNSDFFNSIRKVFPAGFLNMPILIWAIIRLGQNTIPTLLLMQTAIAVSAALEGAGPFALSTPESSLLNVQFFLISRAVTFYILTSLLSELQRFKFISNHAAEKHFLIDENAKILYANETACKKLGYTKPEIESLNVMDINPDITMDQIKQDIDLMKSKSHHSIEATLRTSDGKLFPVEVTLTPITFDGRASIFAVARDISERKRQESEIHKMSEELRLKAVQLEIANQDLENFASTTSHDLKAPLRTITSFISLLQKEYKPQFNAEASEWLQIIVDSSKRMQRLIEDLLRTAKFGRASAKKEMVSLSETLKGVLLDLQTEMAEANATVRCDQMPNVFGNTTYFRELFQNLISNSIKYRTKEAPYIKVSAEQRDKDWLISVKDNGIGIPKEHRKRIFESYVRLHDTAYDGTGLGLATCKKIVESLGGQIWCEPAEPAGTEFLFSLPKGELNFSSNNTLH